MDYLRQGIHLRGYAQKDPKQEYKREAFEMFSMMLDNLKYDVISALCRVQLRSQQEIEEAERQQQLEYERLARQQSFEHTELDEVGHQIGNNAAQTNANTVPKVGRNDPCPCGSGKKYKNCHGRL